MFCRFCGSQIPDGASFCPNCGANLAGPAAQQTPGYSQQAPGYSQQAPGNQTDPRYSPQGGQGPQGSRPAGGYRAQGHPASPGYGRKGKKAGYQGQDSYQTQAGTRRAASAGKAAKAAGKAGGLGKIALTAAAVAVGVGVAASVFSGGGDPPTGGTKHVYETTAGNSGNSSGSSSGKKSGGSSGKSDNSGKSSGKSDNTGKKTEKKKTNPISGGKIVAVNAPLTVVSETGFPFWDLSSVIAQYGTEAPKHIETLPFKNEIQISGDNITIKLPDIIDFTYEQDLGNMGKKTIHVYRDQLTLHGTIVKTGQTVQEDGVGYNPSDPSPAYYTAGTIDSIDAILDNGAFSAKWEEMTTGTHDYMLCKNMSTATYPRNGETEKFSKFYLTYFPNEDLYQMKIYLYGDTVTDSYYPMSGYKEKQFTVNSSYPYANYNIFLSSKFELRLAGENEGIMWK